MTKRTTTIIVGVVVLVIAVATIVGTTWNGGSQSMQESTASSTVAAFGATLQKVSLMAPDASSTIASTYAPYVDAALLKQWEKDPESAPGRVTSSPWPDRIQIDTVTPQGQSYIVNGEIIFMTSNEVEHGGNAGTTPVVIQLVREDGVWKIVAFQGQKQR